MGEDWMWGLCTYFVGGTRVCYLRINFGGQLLRHLQHLHLLNVKKSDIVEMNFGLW
jgi:hypothetical protein